jgi:hypothetical protein
MKRTRKQPRRMTPPLMLRDQEGGRECVEVDTELVTTALMQSGRVRAILTLSPGLKVAVGSRCFNKVRVPVIHISAPNGHADPPTCRACGSDLERHGHAPDCENLLSYRQEGGETE